MGLAGRIPAHGMAGRKKTLDIRVSERQMQMIRQPDIRMHTAFGMRRNRCGKHVQHVSKTGNMVAVPVCDQDIFRSGIRMSPDLRNDFRRVTTRVHHCGIAIGCTDEIRKIVIQAAHGKLRHFKHIRLLKNDEKQSCQEKQRSNTAEDNATAADTGAKLFRPRHFFEIAVPQIFRQPSAVASTGKVVNLLDRFPAQGGHIKSPDGKSER